MIKISRLFLKPALVGLILAILLVCILAGISLLTAGRFVSIQTFPTAIITKIPVITKTPHISSTRDGTTESINTNNSDITVGSFVQIMGTGGVGLRMRLAPGTENTPQFVAMENEVFEVRDGPVYADEFIWWFLVAPYDENRRGWAAGSYLTVITRP